VTAPTLTEFLLARIAEDEDVARSADTGARWEPVALGVLGHPRNGYMVAEQVETEQGMHIARHDPARVLAECEAKRRIMEAADEATGLDMQVDGEFRVGARDETAEPYIGDVILRALALPYADHPDHDEAWRA